MLKKNCAEPRAIADGLAEASMNTSDAKAGHLFMFFATQRPPADRVALLAAFDALRAEQRAWEAARPGAA